MLVDRIQHLDPMTRFGSIATMFAVLSLIAVAAGAEEVGGEARVIDGKTLEVAGQRFRLFGVDTPDLARTCRWPDKVIPCGKGAKTAMMDLVAQTRVVCTPQGGTRAGVRLARRRAGGFDLGGNMVHMGWALAYRPETDIYAADRGQDQAGPPWPVERPVHAALGVAPGPLRDRDAARNGGETRSPVPTHGHSCYNSPSQAVIGVKTLYGTTGNHPCR